MFNYTPLLISEDWQKYAANIIKPTQTGICRKKFVNSETTNKFYKKTRRDAYSGLDLSIHVIKSPIQLTRQYL